MRFLSASLALMGLTSTILVSEVRSEGATKDVLPDVGLQHKVLAPSDMVAEPIDGLSLTITQVSYPGVPERSSCRLLARADNRSSQKVGLFVMVHTFDTQKAPLNSWLIPTADIDPGKAAERLYSCKLARWLYLDVNNAMAWPAICHVDGEERSPCPVRLDFTANIELMEHMPAVGGGGEQKEKPKH